jgi:hypothetical protein
MSCAQAHGGLALAWISLTMKRKLDPTKKKLNLDQATVTVLTPQDFSLVVGGGKTDHCVGECGLAVTVRRCAF